VTYMKRLVFPVLAVLAVSACGNGGVEESSTEVAVSSDAPEASLKPGDEAGRTSKPQLPVTIDYKIIGAPIVGQPVAVDLNIRSTMGPQAITLSYRVNDSTAMQFAATQSARVSIATSEGEEPSLQQVRVVPLREGRLYLNVSATIDGAEGAMSTVIAIPIQVGAAPREDQENGALIRDESGEAIHSLPAKED